MSQSAGSEPVVNVVIPTYNRPEYLEGAIRTAIDQTYDNLEVVVVDDGSEPEYVHDVASVFPDTVSYVVHETNRGLSAARNTGVENADGEYVAFLDDDDRWHRQKIEKQVTALERNEAAALATCLCVAITPDGDTVHCESAAPSGDISDDILVGNQIGTPSRVLVRRECLEEVGGFDESLPTKQDWDLYLRLCQQWQVAAVQEHLCFRTVHESMSSSPESADQDNHRILSKHQELMRERNRWDQARAEISERVGRAYFHAGRLQEARKHLTRSFALERSTRRGVLLALSYTHPTITRRAIGVKRWVSGLSGECANVPIAPDTIPGLNS